MVIASEWYAAVFPNLHLAKETGLELVTSQGGSRYATSVGGMLTGQGADLIIVDDPLNANEVHSETARKRVIDWYGGALVSRLNDKRTGSIIAVMQRLHEDDLAGHLLRQGGWNHLNMPAIALEEETIELGRGGTHLRRSGDIAKACRACVLRPRCTKGVRAVSRLENEDALDRMAERLKARPEILDRRREMVEHPFGSIKQWMNQGAFLMRGLQKVRAEFSLTALVYNLRRALNILGVETMMAAVRG